MVTKREIKEVARRIVEEFNPERIILFGSYAKGTATEDSDVDLLVILPFKGKAVSKSVQIRLKIRPPFPLDLIVRTPQRVRKRVAMGDDFMLDIVQNGSVLFEADGC